MTILKRPCIVDLSHWNTIDWGNFDNRVVGVIIKATESKDYKDPDCKRNFDEAGKLGLPRSLYHFFQPNDVSAQAENYLSYAEEIGAIVNGKWVAEIEPVLDAEFTPALKTDIVGKELANQYKVWLDIVESRTGKRPIVYSSEQCLNFTRDPIYWTSWKNEDGDLVWGWMTKDSSLPPYWAGTYKLWTAGYPDKPDNYNAPYSMPMGWDKWFMWQYAVIDGAIRGVSGKTDLNLFNGTLEEWKTMYPTNGGGEPPMPTRYKVTTSKEVNVRDRGGPTLGNKVGVMSPTQTGCGYETMGTPGGQYYCIHVTEGLGFDGWIYQRHNFTNTYATISVVEVIEPPVEPPPPPSEGEKTFSVSMVDNQTGEVYSGTLMKGS